jgi:hypothetical protein
MCGSRDAQHVGFLRPGPILFGLVIRDFVVLRRRKFGDLGLKFIMAIN